MADNSNRLGSFVQEITTHPLAQQTYYKVALSFSGITPSNNDWLKKMQDLFNPSDKNNSYYFDLYVQAATLPGKRLTTLELKKHNITIRMPGNVEYDGTWTCEVLIDQSLQVYKQLLAWQNYYSDIALSGGGERGFPVATASIYALNNMYKEIQNSPDGIKPIQTLYGVYPTNVPELSYSQEGNEYLKPSVEFAYSWSNDIGITSAPHPSKGAK